MGNGTKIKYQFEVILTFLMNFIFFIYEKMNNGMEVTFNYFGNFKDSLYNLRDDPIKLLCVFFFYSLFFISVFFLIINHITKDEKKNNKSVSSLRAYQQRERNQKSSTRKITEKKKNSGKVNEKKNNENIDYENAMELKKYSSKDKNEEIMNKEKKSEKKKKGNQKLNEIPIANPLCNDTDRIAYIDLTVSELNLKEKEKEKAILDEKKKTRGRRSSNKKNTLKSGVIDEPLVSRYGRMLKRKNV